MNFFLRLAILSSLLTPALIAASCSSLSEKADVLDSKQESLLLAYEKAHSFEKTDAVGSCSLYTRLAMEDFPLKDLSLIKAHMTCPNPETLPMLTPSLIEKNPWLTGLDLDLQEMQAQQKKDFSQLGQVYLRKAQWANAVRDKIQWLQKAHEALQTANPSFPLDEKSQDLWDDLHQRLNKLAPRFSESTDPKDFFRIGTDWIYNRQFAKGRDFLKKILEGSDFSSEEKYLAFRALRNSYKTEQNKESYLKECERLTHWLEKNSSPQRVHEAAVTWARAMWTEGHANQAQKILDRLEHKFHGTIALDEINFIRAKIAEENQDFDQALQLLNVAQNDSKEKSPFWEKILFSKAWLLRKKSLFPEAVEIFSQLKRTTQDPFDRNKYSFWLAKSLKQSGQGPSAELELQELTTQDPLGYYGLMAYRELPSPIPPLENKIVANWKKPSAISTSDHQLVQALTYVSESELLEKFLDQKSLEIRNLQSQDQDLWLYLLTAYARAGLYNPLFQQLGSMAPDLKNKLLLQHPDLLFPRKYLELVENSATKFGLKPEMILSIIRQESAFNPEARSPADALGLMQVMPSVARLHQKETGQELDHFEDLYKPDINIPFGSAILSALSKKYRQQFVLTVAGYNANENAIQNWIKTRLHDDPLEFIEDIPYEETRAYIKLVLRNFIFYSRLSSPGKPLPFPNWCLEDLQSFKVSTR